MEKVIKILVGSTNKYKKNEIEKIIDDLPVQISSLNDFDNIPEIIEDGLTFKDNAIKKASCLAKWHDTLTLADDSGLEVLALDNRPGVYSARYAGEGASNEMRIAKLLKEMLPFPEKDRVARFKCAIALADPQKTLFVVEAKCNGIITKEPRGENGFGYDPVFYFPEYDKTFAEMAPETKNKISHRAKALVLFKDKFKKMFGL